jgi:hypothetical protein
MRISQSPLTLVELLPPVIFLEALEIAGAAVLGRYCGTRVAGALRAQPYHRPPVGGTLRIVRFLIAYVAILMIVWALEFSDLSFSQEVAVIVLAAFVGGSVLEGRTALVKAVCSGCGKPMVMLAETSAVTCFGCQTCGTTLRVRR